MSAQMSTYAQFTALSHDHVDFSLSVAREMIDRHDDRHTELQHVFYMPA